MKIHLCDTCTYLFATCTNEAEYGNGIGNDNVIRCNNHRLKIPQFELIVKDLDKENFPPGGIYIPESDYGLATISLSKDKEEYIINEIPMYGGNPSRDIKVKTSQQVINIIRNLT